jgi:RHS repeat-associated protein
MYVPSTGRFLSRDPFAPKRSPSRESNEQRNEDTGDPYVYARNNPASFLDATGKWPEFLHKFGLLENSRLQSAW